MSEALEYLKMAAFYEKRYNKLPRSAARWDLAARDARAYAALTLRKLKESSNV